MQVLSPRAGRDVIRSLAGRCCEVDDELDGKMAESFLAKETAAVVLPWSAIQSRNDRMVNNIFTCHLCTYFGTSRQEFDRHMTGNHYIYKCPDCNYSSRTQGRLRRHLTDFHLQYQPPDNTCFTANSRRTRRLKTIACKYCEYTTMCREEFWRHLERHIPPERQLRCSRCPFVTDLKHHFQYHQRRHSGVKPFRCGRCGYSCVNRSMLNSHSKSHSNIFPFRCATCSFATKYSHALKLHLFRYRHSAGPVINKDGSLRFPSDEETRSSGRASSPGKNRRNVSDDIRRRISAGFHENRNIRTTSAIHEAARNHRNAAIAHEVNGFRGQMELGPRDGETSREDWIRERQCEASGDFSIANGFRLNCRLPSPGITSLSASLTKLRKYLSSSYPCSDYYSCVSGILDRDIASRPKFPAAYRNCASELLVEANITASEKVFELQSPVYRREERVRLKTPSSTLADIGSRVYCYGDREIDCEMFEFDRNRMLTEPLDLTKRKKEPIDSELNAAEHRTGGKVKCEKSKRIASSPQIISPSKDNNYNAPGREESLGRRGSSNDSNELVFDRREFVCLHCRMVFQDPIIHLIHASYHGDVDPFQCRLCGERCSDRREFMVHLFQAAH